MVWLCAGRDDAAYKMYRKKFRTETLFPKDHPLLQELWNRYDYCSKLSHPSIYSICKHIKVEATDNEVNIRFNYFELENKDPSEPIRTFLWTIDTHFGIIRVFEEVLHDVLAQDRMKWEIRRNAVDAKLGIHKMKWKNII